MTTETKTRSSILDFGPVRKFIGRSRCCGWFSATRRSSSLFHCFTSSHGIHAQIEPVPFPIEWIPDPITIANFTHIFADVTLPICKMVCQ